MDICASVSLSCGTFLHRQTAAHLPAKLRPHVQNPSTVKEIKWIFCMSICVLLLDNEKRFLRDTGREKSKQLERENGEGGRETEREQRRAVWMWLMRSLRGRLCHCESLRSEQEKRRRGMWRREREGRQWEGSVAWLAGLHLTHCCGEREGRDTEAKRGEKKA